MLKLTSQEVKYLRELEAMTKMPNEDIFAMTEQEIENYVEYLWVIASTSC